jgi:hypothetical protein
MGAAKSSSSDARANNPVRPSHRCTPAIPVSAIKRRVFRIVPSAWTLPATGCQRMNASHDLSLSIVAGGSRHQGREAWDVWQHWSGLQVDIPERAAPPAKMPTRSRFPFVVESPDKKSRGHPYP